MAIHTTIKKTFTISGHNAAIYSLCKGTDEHSVISGSGDKYIAQWNILKGEQDKFSAKLPSPVFSLLPLYHFGQLWVGTGSGQVHVIDINKREEIRAFKFHSQQVFDLKYSDKTNLVYSSGGDGTLSVYHPEKLEHLHSGKFSAAKIRSIEIFGSEIILAEGSGKTIILNLSDLSIKHDFVSHKLAANCYCADEHSGILFSGGRDAHLNLWDMKNNFHLIRSIPAHNFAIYEILDLQGTGMIATASRDKTIKLWNKETMEVLSRINKENCQGHAFSVNTILWNEELSTLISAGDDKLLMTWNIAAV